MKKNLFLLLNFLIILALTVPATAFPAGLESPAPQAEQPLGIFARDGDPSFPRPVELRFDPDAVPAVFMPPLEERLRPATATIVVDYLSAGAVNAWGYTCMAFPAAAQTSMQAAADAWEPMINSTVTIRIEACWADLSGSILGGSGTLSTWMNFTNRPVADTFYPVAQANALYGSDLDPASNCTGGTPVTRCNDMAIIYNNDYINNFYYGTDGNTGGKTDFMSVVMHEIAHSLGFAGSMKVQSGLGYWGIQANDLNYYPTSYDRFTYDNGGTALLSYSRGTAGLATALTTATMTFRGANAKKAYCETNVPLYTPASWAQGSSYSHFSNLMDSYDRAQNAMMTFSIGVNEVYHHPGAMALGLLRDVGWNISDALNVPTGVSAVPASTTSILISWTDNNAGETGYVIERSPNGTDSWTVITTTAANATSYTNTGLTTGTPYYYKVRAANGASVYCASSVVNATPAAVLNAPGSLSAVAASTSQINLTWTDTNSSPNESNIYVQHSTTGAGGSYTTLATLTANAVSYNHSSLTEGTQHYYQVIAHGTTDSPPSSPANAITPLVAPGAPAAVTASDAQINISWTNASSNETGYKVEWSPDGSTNWQVAATTAANATSYPHTGRAEGTRYYYRITAVNAVAQSTPTSTVNALTLLKTPTNLLGGQVPGTTNKVSLYWTDTSGLETGFTVERSANGSTGWATACTAAANTRTCTDTGASLGLWYYHIRTNRTTAPTNNSAWSTNTQVRLSSLFYFTPVIRK